MNVILNEKYELKNVNEGITLQESLDSIAYSATIILLDTDELRKLNIKKKDRLRIVDIHAEKNQPTNLFDGVVWEVVRSRKNRTLTIAGRERTVFMEESEDDFLLPTGQTATQRITKYAKDWNIPIASLIDTKIKLEKAQQGGQKLLDRIDADLKETAQKGGNLYKIRMLDKLNIIQLGSNKNIWKLETVADDIETTSSLESAVTRVKVLGQDKDDGKATPVIGVYSKDIDKYGTLQKILQDEKVTNATQAKAKAANMFSDGKEVIHITCNKDVNTIRSGDAIMVDGVTWYVMDITHNMNIPYTMDINAGKSLYIRRAFYSDE
jgi:hypothetical protein